MSSPLWDLERQLLYAAGVVTRLRDARMSGAWAREQELWSVLVASHEECSRLMAIAAGE